MDVPHLRRSKSFFPFTRPSGFLPKTRKSGAFRGPFACARLQRGLICGRASGASLPTWYRNHVHLDLKKPILRWQGKPSIYQPTQNTPSQSNHSFFTKPL